MEFDDTFDALYPGLVRYVHRLTGDADAAEDVAQEALVRLFQGGVDGPLPALRSWVFRTAIRLVQDRWRVEGNRLRLLRENPDVTSTPDPPDRVVERREERRRARRALDALPERDRRILLLRYEGFSYREIAEVVGVAPTSVGTLLARAERRFAHALGDA